MAKITHTYEKLDENGKIKPCPISDFDGSITGHIVIGVRQWFDENPDEARRLGWIKHIYHRPKDLNIAYDRATQYLRKVLKQVDEWTVEDDYVVLEKSEEQMRLEETLGGYYEGSSSIVWTVDDLDLDE